MNTKTGIAVLAVVIVVAAGANYTYRNSDEPEVTMQDGAYVIGDKRFIPQEYNLPADGEIKILSDYVGTLFAYNGTVIWSEQGTQGFELVGDLKTFRFIPKTDDTYFVVNNTVYYIGDYKLTALKGVDAQTVEFAGDCAYVEKNRGFYLKDKFTVFLKEKIVSRDPQNFVAYKVDWYPGATEVPGGEGYAKDLKKVFYGCGDELEGADSASFQYLGNGYAKDARQVEYFGSVLPGTNHTTFTAPK